MGAKIGIPVPHEAIADFCRRHGIRRFAFFGSVIRDDFTPESDVDVLVEFEPGRGPARSSVTSWTCPSCSGARSTCAPPGI